jgi:hypothetical protein
MGLLKTAWLAIKMRIVWFLITAAVIAGAILIFGPRSKNVDTLRRVLAGRVLDEVIADIERRYIRHQVREKLAVRKKLAVLDFAGKGGDTIAELLRKRLRRKGMLVEHRKSTLKKALDKVGITSPTGSPDKAGKLAKELGADAAVFGRVEEFSRDRTRGAVRVEVALAEAESGSETMRHSYAALWPAGMLDRVASVGAGWRLLIWLGVAVLLPLGAYPVAQATLERESNALSFLFLVGTTIIDLAAALFLLGFAVRTVWVALLVIAAFVAAGAYNYLVLNSYEKMRT